MFQRILVPLDGSLRAERALPLATRIARTSQGTLILLHVVGAAAESGPDTPSQPFFTRTLVQTQMEEAQQYLTALASSRAFTGISLTAAALPGLVVPTIQAAMHTYQADLLVLCAQSDPQEQSQLTSGLAGQLIEHIDAPLLLVPEQGPHAGVSHADQHHQATILVAFDGPQPASSLMEPASSLLTALNGRGQGYLRFVPIHTSHVQPEAPAFGKQRADRPVSPVGVETRQTKMPVLAKKDRVLNVKQGLKKNDGVLVLEIPAKSKRAEWIAGENQHPLLSEQRIPLLLVPSLGVEEQGRAAGGF